MAQRVVRSYRQTINAACDVVFPLLCPVREVEWLDTWAFEWIHSDSGLAEPGAIFKTSAAGEADTIWVMSRHDRGSMRVQFTRVTPNSRVCLLDVALTANAAGNCFVDLTYAITATAPAGDEFLEKWTEESFLNGVTFWERSMNHFLKTGTQLPA